MLTCTTAFQHAYNKTNAGRLFGISPMPEKDTGALVSRVQHMSIWFKS